MHWYVKNFSELSVDELYDALKLRVDVFVVEQTCYYPELDDKDRLPDAFHLFAYEDGKLAAYLRGLPKGSSYAEYVSIGRVATSADFRGQGLGHEMMEKAVEACLQRWPNEAIKISAQEHLQDYYGRYGFKTVSDMYLEDDIPHVAMVRSA